MFSLNFNRENIGMHGTSFHIFRDFQPFCGGGFCTKEDLVMRRLKSANKAMIAAVQQERKLYKGYDLV